ncbi:MAG: alkaline phosphatase family protein [Myxococcales bacterium]|nr:alkaline phosphatase family protein [Myxococcales bacterium]
MTAKHLVFGVDGADLSVVQAIGPGGMPAFHRFMNEGAFAKSRSVLPPATLPNWSSFLTGVNPGKHGVVDFTLRRGYDVSFTAGTIREVPTVATHLDRAGLRVACVGFPATWPPEKLKHGVFISGWDSPVAFEADRSFVWPPDLYDRIRQRFGTPSFDDVDEFHSDRPGWIEALADRLTARIERKTELASWLLRQGPWDLFAFYFGETDTAAHHLWSVHDPDSPRRPLALRGDAVEGAHPTGLERVYQAIDRAVGRLTREGRGEVTVISDHGSGGSSDRVLYLNRVLEETGFLRFRSRSPIAPAASFAKRLALRGLPPGLRERLFRLGGAALPSWLESRSRFGPIDWSGTRVFSDELNYFPALHVNLRGREPEGTVDPKELPRLGAELRATLLSLRDPWDGNPIVRTVFTREELFHGPHTDRAPDFLLDLHLAHNYSYNLMPTASAPPGTGPFRRLAEGEWLGKKGRSLPGSHRDLGLFIAHGSSVMAAGEIDMALLDATPTLLARMGQPVPPHMDGRVLWEILDLAALDAAASRSPTPPSTLSSPGTEPKSDRGKEGRVAARLRALGYIE